VRPSRSRAHVADDVLALRVQLAAQRLHLLREIGERAAEAVFEVRRVVARAGSELEQRRRRRHDRARSRATAECHHQMDTPRFDSGPPAATLCPSEDNHMPAGAFANVPLAISKCRGGDLQMHTEAFRNARPAICLLIAG
jgi:hypothetical protein